LHRDLSFGLRQLFKNRTFGAIAVLTLALAIGANTAIFSAVDAVLLQPLPYPNPDQLVTVVKNVNRFSRIEAPVSPPEVLDFRTMATCFSSASRSKNIEINEESAGSSRLRLTTSLATTRSFLPSARWNVRSVQGPRHQVWPYAGDQDLEGEF
jgi:hypothetical protein